MSEIKTLEEKSLIYKVVKERYLWEHERKNEINNSISIPMGVITVLVGCLAYFFNNKPQNSNTVFYILYCTLICFSIISLAFCLFCFFKHQTGYDYYYISSPDKLYEYEKEYIKNFDKKHVEVDYSVINDQVCNFLYEQYMNAATKNKENNERKIKYYRYLIMSIMVCIVLLSGAFWCRNNLNDQELVPIKIETASPVKIELEQKLNMNNNIPENIHDDYVNEVYKDIYIKPKEENMSDNKKDAGEQQKMTASQVPVPEPPKMEMCTESYNPINFTKERIINFSVQKKEK